MSIFEDSRAASACCAYYFLTTTALAVPINLCPPCSVGQVATSSAGGHLSF